MPLGIEVGSAQTTVLDGNPASSPKKGAEPPLKFSAHVYCDQKAGWTKMTLGTEVGLSPGDFVLDRHPPLPSSKRGWSHQFSDRLLRPKGCSSRCHFVRR